MSSRRLIAAVLLIVLVVGGWVWYSQRQKHQQVVNCWAMQSATADPVNCLVTEYKWDYGSASKAIQQQEVGFAAWKRQNNLKP